MSKTSGSKGVRARGSASSQLPVTGRLVPKIEVARTNRSTCFGASNVKSQ